MYLSAKAAAAWYHDAMHANPTIETYNRYAEMYDQEVIEFWEQFPEDFIEEFANATPGRRVLDVGSGSGRDALLLRDAGFDVICQDGSQRMIDMTTKFGFESHLADFTEIDFPGASFDGIWAYTSLIHIPKEEAREIIQKLHGLLKPNGTFAIGVIQGETAGMVERKSMPGTSRYFKHYSSDELKELIESLGFTFLYENKYQPHNSVYLNQLYRVNS